jgi:Mn2+/Fe2+ NRAMP family transporter
VVPSRLDEESADVGLRIFGVVLWAAAITSVIGASYTTVSFVTSRTGTSERLRTVLVCGFIAFTTLVFVSVGTPPTTLLVFAGAFNGLLLPFGIGVLLWVATRRADLLHVYTYPRVLLGVGWLAWLLTVYLAANSVKPVIELF